MPSVLYNYDSFRKKLRLQKDLLSLYQTFFKFTNAQWFDAVPLMNLNLKFSRAGSFSPRDHGLNIHSQVSSFHFGAPLGNNPSYKIVCNQWSDSQVWCKGWLTNLQASPVHSTKFWLNNHFDKETYFALTLAF